ncbi:hypothetical protein TNCV_4606311 [Trichonephila clavipes]|nr:hypothetical protein TNCV_4606311 [Trichonephila clavipes]
MESSNVVSKIRIHVPRKSKLTLSVITVDAITDCDITPFHFTRNFSQIQASRYSLANRRAPLTSTDSGSLRSRTRRQYPLRDRSHSINATTNQRASSRKRGRKAVGH